MNRTVWVCVVMCLVLGTAFAEKDKDAKLKTAEEAVQAKITKPGISGTLRQAIDRIAELGSVRILVDWSALSDAGAEPETKVSVLVPSATVGQLLDIALAQAARRGRPLAWYADGATVHVSTQARVLARNRFPLGRETGAKSSPNARASASSAGPVARLNFQNVGFGNVITFFREVSGVNFHMNWKALETVGVSKDTEVTLEARGISIARALDLICSDLSANADKFDRVYWVVDQGIVEISTGAALNTTLSTRTFDVTDLLAIVPDFEGPRMDFSTKDTQAITDSRTGAVRGGSLFPQEDADKDTDEKSIGEQRAELREKLIGIIKQSIGEEMWQPVGKGDVRIFRNQLVISQTKLGFKLLDEAVRR